MDINISDELRLQALKNLKIMDTPREETYDDLVRLVANLCACPMALISLVDDSRQWFKSKIGLKAEQTPRDQAFCAHAIRQGDVFIVQDASLDERFQNNPLVQGHPFIRFYAGTPLTLKSGHRVGTLCVLDTRARQLSDLQKGFLQTLGRQVVALLESRAAAAAGGALLESALQTIENQKIQIMKASQLSALGELAAGVAHEINNPLEIIVARAEKLLGHAKTATCTPEVVAADAKRIETTSLRIAEIVRSVLSVARSQPLEPQLQEVSLKAIYKHTQELCQERLRKYDVQLKLSPPESDLRIRCSEVQLNQVLLNLINNSIDAIQDLPIRWIFVETTSTNDWIEIAVTDSGSGLSSRVQQNLMKPFFTTKPIGEGTGLGLAISQKIMTAQGGSLIYDPASSFTRFCVRLPR